MASLRILDSKSVRKSVNVLYKIESETTVLGPSSTLTKVGKEITTGR